MSLFLPFCFPHLDCNAKRMFPDVFEKLPVQLGHNIQKKLHLYAIFSVAVFFVTK